MTKINQKLKLAGLILAAGTLTGCDKMTDCVVKCNTDNVIVFTPLSDTTDVHVMAYDTRYVPEYTYIRPGDTITGAERNLRSPMVSAGYFEPGLYYYKAIQRVNGEDLYYFAKIRCRDSLLNKINYKHR